MRKQQKTLYSYQHKINIWGCEGSFVDQFFFCIGVWTHSGPGPLPL
jgi:hypothetical protein